MQDKLVAFVRQQINAGYDINSIRNHLIGVGYPADEVNSAIGFVTGGADESIKQKLIPFILQQKHLGYDENNIRAHLIKSGYPAEIVNKSVKEAYEGHKAPARLSKLNFAVIGGIVVVLVAVIGIVMLFTGGEGGGRTAEPQLLDFEVSALMQSVKPGDELKFSFDLTSMGSFRRYDMQITHRIYNSAGKAITFKKETVAIETKVSKSTAIPVPLTAAPGKYTLESVARYNGKTAEASLEFEIVSRETAEGEGEAEAEGEEEDIGEIPAEAEGEAEGENDTGEIELPEVEPDATFASIEQDVKNYASQPGKARTAAGLCELLQIAKEKDTCYLTVAQTSMDKSYCETIENNYRKDVCYLTFQEAGDYTVCDSMQDEELRASCEALKARGEAEAVAEGESEGEAEAEEEQLNITNATEAPAAEGEGEEEAEGEAEGEEEAEEGITEPATGTSFSETLAEVAEIAQTDIEAAKAICSNMTNTDQKDQCYIIIVNTVQDKELCKLMSTTVTKDQCYLNYVMRSFDESACDLISDDILKSQCRMFI